MTRFAPQSRKYSATSVDRMPAARPGPAPCAAVMIRRMIWTLLPLAQSAVQVDDVQHRRPLPSQSWATATGFGQHHLLRARHAAHQLHHVVVQDVDGRYDHHLQPSAKRTKLRRNVSPADGALLRVELRPVGVPLAEQGGDPAVVVGGADDHVLQGVPWNEWAK